MRVTMIGSGEESFQTDKVLQWSSQGDGKGINKSAGGLPVPLPPGLAAAAAAAVPGMSENHQMQANLNDYYARWWTSYALGEEDNQEDKPKEQPLAFDKEAAHPKALIDPLKEPPSPP
eukprot:s4684_g2.t1